MTARIEQTRHTYDPGLERPRGLLRTLPPAGAFRHARRRPPPDLAAWVEHFWSVRWDLTSVSSLRNRIVPANTVFCPDADQLAARFDAWSRTSDDEPFEGDTPAVAARRAGSRPAG